MSFVTFHVLHVVDFLFEMHKLFSNQILQMILEFELDDESAAFEEAAANWVLQDISLLGTVHEIDSALASSYASHVLTGKQIHLHYTSVVSPRHLAPGPSFTIHLVRGFPRLRQTLHRTRTEKARQL